MKSCLLLWSYIWISPVEMPTEIFLLQKLSRIVESFHLIEHIYELCNVSAVFIGYCDAVLSFLCFSMKGNLLFFNLYINLDPLCTSVLHLTNAICVLCSHLIHIWSFVLECLFRSLSWYCLFSDLNNKKSSNLSHELHLIWPLSL